MLNRTVARSRLDNSAFGGIVDGFYDALYVGKRVIMVVAFAILLWNSLTLVQYWLPKTNMAPIFWSAVVLYGQSKLKTT